MTKFFPYLLVLSLVLLGCQREPAEHQQAAVLEEVNGSEEPDSSRPTLSLTFDDGMTTDILDYPFEEWNAMILDALAAEDLQAIFFVTGANKRNKKGHYLLQAWSDAGHHIANGG